jgi:hypothetical protein
MPPGKTLAFSRGLFCRLIWFSTPKFNPDKAAFQNSLAALPLVTYQAGETVIGDGSKTGRLLILSRGA